MTNQTAEEIKKEIKYIQRDITFYRIKLSELEKRLNMFYKYKDSLEFNVELIGGTLSISTIKDGEL